MQSAKLNIVYTNNDELDKTYAVTDADGAAVDLSAKALTWTVKRKKADDSYLIQLTTAGGGLTVGGAESNEVTLSGSYDLQGRAYYHDIENTTDDDTIWTGSFSVIGDVSRDPDIPSQPPVDEDGNVAITGTLDVEGETTLADLTVGGNLTLSDTQFDDMRFPATSGKKKDTLEFDLVNLGLLFPDNDDGDYVIHQEQFSHSRKHGTDVMPHVHFIQTGASIPVFVMSYRWYDNGATVPSFTTVETDGTGALTYDDSGEMLQITPFPVIDGSALTGVSSWWECKLWRKENDGVSGDVLEKSFDIHYEKDGVGSDTEYTK